jgi:hypothetical protein
MGVLAEALDWGFNANRSITHDQMSAIVSWLHQTYGSKYWERERVDSENIVRRRIPAASGAMGAVPTPLAEAQEVYGSISNGPR